MRPPPPTPRRWSAKQRSRDWRTGTFNASATSPYFSRELRYRRSRFGRNLLNYGMFVTSHYEGFLSQLPCVVCEIQIISCVLLFLHKHALRLPIIFRTEHFRLGLVHATTVRGTQRPSLPVTLLLSQPFNIRLPSSPSDLAPATAPALTTPDHPANRSSAVIHALGLDSFLAASLCLASSRTMIVLAANYLAFFLDDGPAVMDPISIHPKTASCSMMLGSPFWETWLCFLGLSW